jgi:hypothetical protein
MNFGFDEREAPPQEHSHITNELYIPPPMHSILGEAGQKSKAIVTYW